MVPEDLVEHGRARPELIWASLDCPSWYGYSAFRRDQGRILLGRLTAEVRTLPKPGERCVVGGWSVGRDGRKFDCASALWSVDAELIARARALWIEVRGAEPTAAE